MCWVVQAHTLRASLWWQVPTIIIFIIILKIHLEILLFVLEILMFFFIIIKSIKFKNSIKCIINIVLL
jgi:hypothetical protein